jgi:hypothetical protein
MAVRFRFKTLTGKRARVDPAGVTSEAVAFANILGGRIKQQLATYPPERPNSRYTRTHRLGSGWVVAVTSPPSGVNLRVRNPVSYVVPVHGNEAGQRQWAMHSATGWVLVKDVMDQAHDAWNAGIQARLARHPIITWR